MRFLLLNQTFYPDVMASGQYLTDLALALVERGHHVTVLTSRRAYDDPTRTFPKNELWRGIRIIRVGSTWFGKNAKWKRYVNCSTFIAFCAARLCRLPRHHIVIALTSPPLVASLGVCLAKWQGSRLVYWVMDLNPDEAIAAGWLAPASWAARFLERISRWCFYRADKIIALDTFMHSRILAKGVCPAKVAVLPLWSQGLHFDAAGRKRFRAVHHLDSKFVVMYSGNHSPCHPLDTLLAAAARLTNDPGILFCFVGGGSEFRKLHQLQRSGYRSNLRCLPYQPLAQLAGSLSAADLQVVIMGNEMVGRVHPSKVYNLLHLGTPILYIGPEPSPVIQLLSTTAPDLEHTHLRPGANQSESLRQFASANPGSHSGIGAVLAHAMVRHGDVEGIVRHIDRVRRQGVPESDERLLNADLGLSRDAMVRSIIGELERLV
jgi:colanic acid biosynthesis glycosyl transferase WcaI